ncbi:hypothetical protein QTG54_007023 [Skeletonema marinoi]|uniref:Uncharacterized protein n=1 Tax=Skeletonema marinoi TaxID=267567 RepID=A0AAD8YB23_9STRA|nr:hypothetical protein QTG54_007023 [Skeletonema marinoi]
MRTTHPTNLCSSLGLIAPSLYLHETDATMEDCKIKTTCDELDQFLSSLSQSSIPSPDVLHASPTTSDIHHHGDVHHAIVSSTNTEAYRCKCSFQIVADVNDNLACVVRENGTICHLPDGIFPPANFRIREAMKCLINLLNKRSDHTFIRLRENLTSVTFDTSWDEKECLLLCTMVRQVYHNHVVKSGSKKRR